MSIHSFFKKEGGKQNSNVSFFEITLLVQVLPFVFVGTILENCNGYIVPIGMTMWNDTWHRNGMKMGSKLRKIRLSVIVYNIIKILYTNIRINLQGEAFYL